MLCDRNDGQTEGRPVSSTRISSSEDPCSSSCAVKEQEQIHLGSSSSKSVKKALFLSYTLMIVLPQTFQWKIFCHMMPPSQMC